MRVPTWLTTSNFLVAAALLGCITLVLMALGTAEESPAIRSWGIVSAIFTTGTAIVGVMLHIAGELEDFTRRWAHQTFADGWKGGREVGIAEGFALASGSPAKEPHAD